MYNFDVKRVSKDFTGKSNHLLFVYPMYYNVNQLFVCMISPSSQGY